MEVLREKKVTIKKIIALVFILLCSGMMNVYAQQNDSGSVSDGQNLLQDIKIKIISDEQISVTLIFNNETTLPKVKAQKQENDLNLNFSNSYVKIDDNNIDINHNLLSKIQLEKNKNNLNVIFSAAPDALFTLKQNQNTFNLTLMAKGKISEIMAIESGTDAVAIEQKDKSKLKADNKLQEANKKEDIKDSIIQESVAKTDSKQEDIIESELSSVSKDKAKVLSKDISQEKNNIKTEANNLSEDKSKVLSKDVSQEKNNLSDDKSKILSKVTGQEKNGLKSDLVTIKDNKLDAQSESKESIKDNPEKTLKEKLAKITKSKQRTNTIKKAHSKNSSTSQFIKQAQSKFDQIVNGNQASISNFDFKLSENRTGQIVIKFPNKNVVMVSNTSKDKGDNVLQLQFKNTSIPNKLVKKYDVTDFGTVVKNIEWLKDRRSNSVILNVYNKSQADYIAYQKGSNLVIEINDKKVPGTSVFNKTYSGKKISLNFQNIELRSVLQIIADFTSLNLVASDNIQGNISLRLMNVPWDQALDIILKTKSLDKRQFGNILMVAPTNEIFELERSELESEQLLEKLAKLETAYFPINYAKAEDVAQLISGKNKILSERGTASFDKRTNLLIIQDTAKKMKEIREVLKKLDSPVKQVLIEARIVRADTNFRKELGIRWGLSAKRSSNNYQIGIGDTSPNATEIITDGNVVTPKKQADISTAAGDTGFNIDLGLADPSSIIGLALAKLPGKTLVHLELSALESEGLLETVSSPKLITANKVPARIEQGQEIPYQESTSSGATNIAFKKAVLSLVVTPQITPDNKIILDINVTNDTPDFSNLVSDGVPVIDTQEVETQVLVDDSQTIVLGGIFTQVTNNSVERVPFLGDLPVIGQLFRKNVTRDDRSEFLIFITPKVVIDKA